MYELTIYFIGGTVFKTLFNSEKEIEHFKNMIEKKKIKNNNYFLRTQTNEGFNVANINCYQIKKIEKEVES